MIDRSQKLKDNKPIHELATNPLLLTLLCLVFGEAADFPRSRSELYKEGLDVLLKKWDAKRNIERDQVYRNLSLSGKQDLLSQIAFQTFDKSEYFFKQRTVEQQIINYIQNLPNASIDSEALQLDGEAVLKSIEAQHGLLVERARGIYSFSHLTFQEYFTAQKVTSSALDLNKVLQHLSSHITEKRWREVFLLAVEMLRPTDALLQLMKARIDSLLLRDEKLQELLIWINQKALSVESSYKPAVARACYLALPRLLVLDFALKRTLTRDRARDFDFALDHILARARAINVEIDILLAVTLIRALVRPLSSNIARDRARTLYLALDLNLDPGLKQALQRLKDQLPDPTGNLEVCEQWWQANSKAWAEELRAVMIEHRNIGHDWQFSEEQIDKLQQYYDANELLMDCLSSDCYVTRAVREEIEDTLLLPIAEIEKRKQRGS